MAIFNSYVKLPEGIGFQLSTHNGLIGTGRTGHRTAKFHLAVLHMVQMSDRSARGQNHHADSSPEERFVELW